MEDTASGSGEPLLACMKALARRSAALHHSPGSGASIVVDGAGRPPRPVDLTDVDHMMRAGWLRAVEEGRFVLSRRGLTTLRARLNHPPGSSPAQIQPAASKPSAPRTAAISARPTPSAKPTINDRESPLAWLRQRSGKDGRPLIGDNEYLAGEQLRADFERAHLGQRVTASWDPTARSTGQSRGVPGSGLELAEGTVAARQRIDAALKAVGPELGGMLLDVCCYLQGLEQAERNGGWPRRAGKVVLQLGLAHLSRHYGFDRRNQGSVRGIVSWAAPDFRPTIDGN